MKELKYKDFSLKTHQKNWQKKKPNVCQFELTYKCPISCRHCYANCYKKPSLIKKELTTKEVFKILDKVYNANVLWLCLTGGDPLSQSDFLPIYNYARKKGFIITVFTPGILINQKITTHFKKYPPFNIEITLNAVTKKTYENISGVKGSFKKAMNAIKLLRKNKIPFRLKTMATKQNYFELDKIKKFYQKLGQKFEPSSILFVQLDGDLTPAKYRLEPKQILAINKKYKINSSAEEEIGQLRMTNDELRIKNPLLFRCAAGSDTFHINPFGEMFLCSTVREPSINLLKKEIKDGFKIFTKIKAQKFKTQSKCRKCELRYQCLSCPGRAKLETGSAEKPVDYFCQLTRFYSKEKGNKL